eukprot:TRINITY_DN27772_c0_g1_i1.p1 TRINITY_DN27772_c0_g1~~TRINITY_DN27772_c0_g1_i1.p1  ORF type:complete len:183 (-),score=36.62 TRINITY_DN27772_c0_g1_i1:327-848(-)
MNMSNYAATNLDNLNYCQYLFNDGDVTETCTPISTLAPIESEQSSLICSTPTLDNLVFCEEIEIDGSVGKEISYHIYLLNQDGSWSRLSSGNSLANNTEMYENISSSSPYMINFKMIIVPHKDDVITQVAVYEGYTMQTPFLSNWHQWSFSDWENCIRKQEVWMEAKVVLLNA